MKVLIIGGTGVLSNPVLLSTLENGHEVYIVTRGNRQHLISNQVHLLKCDIRIKGSLEKVIGDNSFDVVVDFLSYTQEQMLETINAIKNKTQQYIFISSCCVYDRKLYLNTPISDEDIPTGNPCWDYGSNKLQCEQNLQATPSSFSYTIVRPYITYGETRIPYGITSGSGSHWSLVARVMHDKPLFVWDNGEALTTITHTKDFACGVTGLFLNSKAHRNSFNIVGSTVISWNNFIDIFEQVLGHKVHSVYIPSDYVSKKLPHLKGILCGDRKINAVFDNTKIKNAVPKFSDTVSLREGLSRTIQHYKENHYLSGIDFCWDAQMDKLIYSWLVSQKIKHDYPLHFINYLRNASVFNKLKYYLHRYLY